MSLRLGKTPEVVISPARRLAEAAIAENAQTFDSMVEVVRSRADEGVGDEQTLRLAQAAAEFAWYNPIGRYAAPDLEEAVHLIGSRLGEYPTQRATAEPDNPRRILHVFSEAQHSAGGHVRFPWRWIRQDP